MQYKTIGRSNHQGKPRVYFCCHEADFKKYFEGVTDELLAIQSCAIYYDTEPVHIDEERALELSQMQLFVMPVTAKLLTTENVALCEEFPFAMEHHIPVLPLMQQPGLSELFKIKCGDLQYLEKYSDDPSAISYSEKLKKYITSVLIGDEMAEKIRAAFDAYVFLSYRKKDRKYAQQLMKLIHRNDFARDIAIWYDEFLVPGESFNDAILDMIKNSNLFSLVVTPNLNEDGNYVMKKEYPAAVEAKKPVFPAKAVETDTDALRRNFAGIPECVDASDETALSEALLNQLRTLAIESNNDDPEHKFLVGLAYLGGVDVEVNHELAVRLITEAAEADLPEAMEKLIEMYENGIGVKLNYNETCKWAHRLANYCIAHYGEEHPVTLSVLGNLALAYGEIGQHQKALEIEENVYLLKCKVLGDENPDTIISLANLAVTYSKLGQFFKSIQLTEKVYALRFEKLGEEHPDTLRSLCNIAWVYSRAGIYERALRLSEKAHALACKVLGEEHPDTISILGTLGATHYELGHYKKALELSEKAYEFFCKQLGNTHPKALIMLNNLAWMYFKLGQYEKELELKEKVYALRSEVLGKEHPDTIKSFKNLVACRERPNYSSNSETDTNN